MAMRWARHTLWLAPHRPLFLLAGLWALAAPTVWLVPGAIGLDATRWHLHELLFGTGGAAVGGYLLTALPAWTGGASVSPTATMSLSGMWVCSRLGFAYSERLPLVLAASTTLAYLVALGLLLGYYLIARRLWSKTWVLGAVAALASADYTVLATGLHDQSALLAVLVFAFLISFIGGRAVPAFTRHWLARTRQPVSVRDRDWLAALAISALAVAALLIVIMRDAVAGGFLILSGSLQLARMREWRSRHSVFYPALLLLHLAWIWLPFGLLLAGFGLIWPGSLLPTAALHGLTMGAMGTMMVAIMSRAAMARKDDVLLLSPTIAFAFALVWLSAQVRVAAGLGAGKDFNLVEAAALLWMAGWALFLVSQLSALRRPVPRPVLSARLTI